MRAIYCLYGVIAAQAISLLTSVYMSLNFIGDPELNLITGYSPMALIGGDLIFKGIIMGFAFYLIPHLKEKENLGWLGALAIFLLTTLTLALPFSLFGLVSLLDRDVRTHFQKSLDINI